MECFIANILPKEIKIEIREKQTNSLIFSLQKENNTIKNTVEAAIKSGVYLKNANLDNADLKGADLRFGYFKGASFVNANLENANISNSFLKCADFTGANCTNLKFYHATLTAAKNVPSLPMNCPEKGEFVGWKKLGRYIIKLLIPADAKRSSATTNKCRCSKAKVLKIYNIDTNGKGVEPVTSSIKAVTNSLYKTTTYKVGEMVYPDSFDDDRWNECSHGIHFFMDKQDAINY